MSNLFLKVDKDLFKLGLNPTQILIVSQVMEFQRNNCECYVTDKQFAENFGVSESTISREIKKLDELKILTKETKNVKGGKQRKLFFNLSTVNLMLVEKNAASTTSNLTVDNQQIDSCTTSKLLGDNQQIDLIKDNIKDNEKKNKEDNRELNSISPLRSENEFNSNNIFPEARVITITSPQRETKRKSLASSCIGKDGKFVF